MPATLGTSAAILADALGRTLHRPGERARQREGIGRAIEAARAEGDHVTLAKALAARAEDARHGANQLSLGSQRAPTRADCDDGWERVEAIVRGAEEAAREAAAVAASEPDGPVVEAARAAQAAAEGARRIVDMRNHAYTFHAAPGFSFGEGWYLAAAGVLGGVAIQVEVGERHTAAAEHFLRAAGLEGQLVPYRSRPRANKHLPEIVARAFREGPAAAQRLLRGGFLGDDPIPAAIVDGLDRALAGAPAGPKVLLWIRRVEHHPHRNTDHAELLALLRICHAAGLEPVLFGDAPEGAMPPGTVDLTFCWKRQEFQGLDMRRAQLQLFEHLRGGHKVIGQLGVTTAGMDGPALMGLPTLYLTDAPNPRLGTWVGAVPGYQEVVRGEGYLARITETLRRWGTTAAIAHSG